jgi:hypothetical protein
MRGEATAELARIASILLLEVERLEASAKRLRHIHRVMSELRRIDGKEAANA